MTATQGEQNQFIHYDVHSLYGSSESIPTREAVQEITGKRGFIVSRSTFPSSNRFTTHWLGDNHSQWWSMRDSIKSLLEFSMFGYSFVRIKL